MNIFIREINGFYNNIILYTDTVILFIERKYWDVSNRAGLVGDTFCQNKNDYKSAGEFYSIFLALK